MNNEVCLSILTFAAGGQGKSTLFESAPGPRFLVDAEGKAGLLQKRVVIWNDLSKLPEATLDADTTYVVQCSDYKRITEIIKILDRYGKNFRSFGCDSISRLQEKLLQQLNAQGVDGFDLWNSIKSQVTLLLDAFAGQAEAGAAVVYTSAWMVARDGSYNPLMDGALKERVGHYNIVVGRPILKFTGSGIKQSMLIFQDTLGDEEIPTAAKSNSMDLLMYYGKVVENPDLTHMHAVLNKQNKKETTMEESK